MEGQFEQKISNLTPDQINMLIQAAQARKGGKAVLDKMKRNSEEIYPLSKAQERLWFLSILSEGEAVYNNPVVISMKADFHMDMSAMKKAVDHIANRHEILRTTFHLQNGKVVQKIHSACDVPVSIEDLRGLTADERQQYMNQKAHSHGNYIFNLEVLPLIRVHFLRMADDEYVLLINAHHLITDGWTNSMFAVELPQLYEAYASGNQPTLPLVSKQYIDYVQTEMDWLKTEDYKRRLGFWKDQFATIPSSPINFFDYNKVTKGYQGGKVSTVFDSNQKAALQAFCRKRKITPFEFTIISYACVIYRYSGQPEIVVGTPVANRNDVRFQQTFGPFINTLPIRLKLDPSLSFNDLVSDISPVIQQALSNQSVPFAVLVEELNPERDIQSNSLFQLHFAFQSFPQLQGTNIRFVNIDYNVSKFDLNLWIEEDMEKWILSFTYRTDSFKEKTVQKLLDHYTSFMQQVINEPNTPIGTLDFMDKQYLSVVDAEDKIDISLQDFWPALFDQACKTHENKIAVIDQEETVTYSELNKRAERLARQLSKRGIQAGELVGVCLDRKAEMIVTIIALFKIGAAYLPLDKNTPQQRLAFIISDAGVRFIINNDKDDEKEIGSVKWLYAGEEAGSMPETETIYDFKYKPDDLAYVIYTSGTTGNPKGVKIGHRSLCNYTKAVWHRMDLRAGDKLANVSSLAADLGNTMIFPALAYGATLLIVPENCLTDALAMTDFYRRHKPDALKIVPSHLLALLNANNNSQLLPEKLLMLGGESCPVELPAKLKRMVPELRIINHYGPTETTIGSLTYEIDEKIIEGMPSVPIGIPLANTSVYILDANKQSVPVGAKGEIYLGGANLSLGYINRPETEAKHFVESPFDAKERLYRTGDYGRLADGKVFFIGRGDRQVKIRGHRIELNEVEYVLRSCRGVKQALVLAPTSADTDQVLTGVITLDELNLPLSSIREEASLTLKSPMLPDKFVVLDSLPVTGNGKIDEAQIRKLAAENNNLHTALLNPRDTVELRLLKIWKEVLQVEELGIEENFFEIGGHSMMAIKLLSLVSEQFGVRLPLYILFEHKNIKQLASVIRLGTVPANNNSKAVIELQQNSNIKNRLYVLHPAGGNVMTYYPLARELKNNCNIYGIQAIYSGRSIVELASLYLDEIINDIGNNFVVFSGWSMGALIAHSMAIEYSRRTSKNCGLIVIDQPAPSKDKSFTKESIGTAERLAVFAEKVSQLVGANLDIDKEKVEGLDARQQSAIFFAKFREHGIVPEDIKEEDFHGFLELMIHHNEITMDYTPPCIFTGPTLIIKASERLELNSAKPASNQFAEDMGWRQFAPDAETTIIPGNHITVINKYVHNLSQAILDWHTRIMSQTN